MPEMAAVPGSCNDLPRRPVDLLAWHSRRDSADRRLLGTQDQVMDRPLPDGRPSNAQRAGDVAEIALRLCSEVDGDQVAAAQRPVRHRCMRHGAVPARRDDDVKGRPASTLLPHEPFEPEPEVALRDARPEVFPQLAERLLGTAHGGPDLRELCHILPLAQVADQVLAAPKPDAGLPERPQTVDGHGRLVEPEDPGTDAAGGLPQRGEGFLPLDDDRRSRRFAPRLDLVPEIGDQYRTPPADDHAARGP